MGSYERRTRALDEDMILERVRVVLVRRGEGVTYLRVTVQLFEKA